MADRISLDLNTKLRRQALPVKLTAEGVPTSAKTLAAKATPRRGLPYRLYGRIPFYHWGAALDCAFNQLSPLMISMFERNLKPGLREHRENHRTVAAQRRIVQSARDEPNTPPGLLTSAAAAGDSNGPADRPAVAPAPALTSAPTLRKRLRQNTRRRST